MAGPIRRFFNSHEFLLRLGAGTRRYYKKEDKNCKWVKKKADARCKAKAKDANGVSVFAACAKACDVCDLACDDDADADAWYSKKDPEKVRATF
tara:strand:+ start:184 stop:465 length:282 start_codon:yes stop_codon:yes gene_type:complete